MSTQQDWTTESGLLDDFDGIVTGARFDTPSNYAGGGQPLLELTVLADDGNETTGRYSLGNVGQWEIINDGEEVVSRVGKQKFVSTSKYGKLIERLTQLDPSCLQTIIGRGNPRMAEVWIGLRFHWKREKFTYQGLGTGETQSLMPTDYLGLANDTPAPTPPPVQTPVAPNNNGQSAMFASLAILADGKSPREIMRAVMGSDDGTLNNDVIMEAIGDKSILKEMVMAGVLREDNGKYFKV